MREDPPSLIEAIARAVRLCEPALMEAWIPSEPERVGLRARVCELGCRDEQAVERIVDRLLTRFEAGEEDLLDEVHWLCTRMSTLRQGLPVLRSGLLPRQLARIASADALFPFYPELRLPQREPFAWSAVPLTHGGRTERLHRDGSVDTHIHLGGALPPVFYWVPLMGGGLHLDLLRDLPAGERGHAGAEKWQKHVGRAVWRRLWLAAFVERLTRGWRLFPWLGGEWFKKDKLAAAACPFTSADEAREYAFDLDASARIRDGEPEGPSFPDPLRPPDGERPHYAAGERRMLYHLGRQLERLREDGGEEFELLTAGLREYLKTRNAFHRLLVHDRGREGLLRFVQSFDRRGFLFGNRPRRTRRQRRHLRTVGRLERARMEAALDAQLIEAFSPDPRGLRDPNHHTERRIEMRVSVPDVPLLRTTLRGWVQGLCDHLGVEEPRRSQVGFVFHFIKYGGRPEHEAAALAAADRLEGVLRSDPWFRRLAVGIDAAARERSSNPRIFLKAFHHLRRLQETFRPEPEEPAIELGYTFHVGEDVDDLLSGLRHIDETVSLLLPPGEGGRLGHALALGEDVARFYDRRGITEPRLGSHLLDLVWAWGRLVDGGDGAWTPWIKSRIQKLCKSSIDERRPSIRRCFERMRLEAELRPQDLLREDQLLEILRPGIGRDLDLDRPQPVPLSRTPWLELVAFLQERLIERVSRRRVCVEANPTSNLLIGDYKDYSELPYPRLVDAGIALSINTDDPGVFMTHLPGEFSAMYDALKTRRVLKHRQILDWLRDRRFDAEQSTFLGKQVPVGGEAVELCEPWCDD